MRKVAAVVLSLLCSMAAHGFTGAPVVDFNRGKGGWEIQARDNAPREGWLTWIDRSAGADGGRALHSLLPNIWDATWVNTSAALTGDYTQAPGVRFAFDLNTTSFLNLHTGEEVLRDVVVELRSFDADENFVSVFFNVGITGADMGWQHFEAQIDNTSSSTLPAGWSASSSLLGDGLPDGVSFADVLKKVDQVRITTAVPGFFYGDSSVNITIDNIAVTAVPEPSTWISLLLGLVLFAARRRPFGAVPRSALQAS